MANSRLYKIAHPRARRRALIEWRWGLAGAGGLSPSAPAAQSPMLDLHGNRPAHFTLLPHNFHRLVKTGAQNMRCGK